SIEMINPEGKSLNPPVFLIERLDKDGQPSNTGDPTINELELANSSEVTVGDANIGMASIGALSGLIESYDVIYPEMLEQLDKLAFEFAKEFNILHRKGTGLDNEGERDFFTNLASVEGAAGLITVRQDILDDSDLIAASGNNTSGN